MKKFLIVLFILLTAFTCLFLTACDDVEESEAQVSVTLYCDGDVFQRLKVDAGSAIEALPEPVLEGHALDGWYYDEAFTSLFDFSDVISEDISLYAKMKIDDSYTRSMLKLELNDDKESYKVMGINPSYGGSEIRIPDTYMDKPITSIAYKAFENNRVIKSVNIGNNVKEIELKAFMGCENLSSVKFGSSVEKIGNYAFHLSGIKDAVFPNSLVSIGSYAFNKSSVETVVFPNTDVYLSNHAFSETPLKTADLSHQKKISENAFSNCIELSVLIFSEKLESIESNAFNGCCGIEEITLPDSLKSLGAGAFMGCTGITELTWPKNLRTVGNSAFEGCTSLVKFTNEILIAQTSENMFRDCTSLEYIKFAEGFQTVTSAFDGCTSLKYVVLPDSCQSLNYKAFYGATALEFVVLPKCNKSASDTTNMINQDAFSQDVRIYFRGTSEEYKNVIAHTYKYYGGNKLWLMSESDLVAGNTVRYYYSESAPVDKAHGYWHFTANGTPVLWK